MFHVPLGEQYFHAEFDSDPFLKCRPAVQSCYQFRSLRGKINLFLLRRFSVFVDLVVKVIDTSDNKQASLFARAPAPHLWPTRTCTTVA